MWKIIGRIKDIKAKKIRKFWNEKWKIVCFVLASNYLVSREKEAKGHLVHFYHILKIRVSKKFIYTQIPNSDNTEKSKGVYIPHGIKLWNSCCEIMREIFYETFFPLFVSLNHHYQTAVITATTAIHNLNKLRSPPINTTFSQLFTQLKVLISL